MSGILVAQRVQDSTTTTGTGQLTLANSLQAGLPNGTTLFGATFGGVAQTFPQNNVFYAIFDGLGNNEYGLGTLLSATVLTRDFVLFAQVHGVTLQTADGTHINYAAGTKQVYSNADLFSNSVVNWQRYPNQTGGNDGGITEDLMSGSFTGVLTDGVGTANVIIRYKVSSSGICSFQLPATTLTSTGTAMSISGIPNFLCNVLTEAVPCYVFGSASGAILVPGLVSLTAGATPDATGTMVFQQYSVVATGFTATFTASVARGWSGNQAVHFPLF